MSIVVSNYVILPFVFLLKSLLYSFVISWRYIGQVPEIWKSINGKHLLEEEAAVDTELSRMETIRS